MASTDFTIADVLAWARTKPADERYNFISAGYCALGQFARERRGWSLANAGRGLYERHLPHGLQNAANPAYGPRDNWGDTFGKFVRRLEALCPETPVTKSDWLAIDAYLTDIEQVDA